ncbi:MAG TPA: hypothetical protein PKA80_00675 [Ignavibacteriaceae bacterium]|nr:hypothetical protein [Ignavibacteriaceae bacterium]
MKITEEILNKYIDGELQPEVLEELNEQLAKSTEDLEKLRALQALHRSLSKISPEDTSADFTRSVMFRINKKRKANNEQRFFIGIVSAVFISLSILIVGYVLYLIVSFSNTANQMEEAFTIVKSYTQIVTKPLEKLFSGHIMTIVGSILSMAILGSAYYFLETFKRIKNNITS